MTSPMWHDRKRLGIGLTFHAELADFILSAHGTVDCVEFIIENILSPQYASALDAVGRQFPLIAHGVSLSLGSAAPLQENVLEVWHVAFQRYSPRWFGEHLAYTSADGEDARHLLPVQRNEASLHRFISKVAAIKDVIAAPILLENITSYMPFPDNSLGEWEFFRRLCSASGCRLILDLNNVAVNAHNFGRDPVRDLDDIPLEFVSEVHVAGASHDGCAVLDSHTGPVSDEVWEMLRRVCRTAPVRAVILERDRDLSEWEPILHDLEIARSIFYARAPLQGGQP
jgi:uncharacterized protein (UPF0276 family)